jgi:hypothetical protein
MHYVSMSAALSLAMCIRDHHHNPARAAEGEVQRQIWLLENDLGELWLDHDVRLVLEQATLTLAAHVPEPLRP